MNRANRTWSLAALLGLALILGGGSRAAAQAMAAPGAVKWLGYKNDTQMVVVVQGGSLQGGRLVTGLPHKINPKESDWDQVVALGPKIILIYNPKDPRQVYYRGQIIFGGADQFYSIQSDGVGPDKVPKVKLVPIPVPPRPKR